MILTLTGIAPTHRNGCVLDITLVELIRLGRLLSTRGLEVSKMLRLEDNDAVSAADAQRLGRTFAEIAASAVQRGTV